MPDQQPIQLNFKGWSRSSVYELVDPNQQPVAGRLQGNLSLTMREIRANAGVREAESQIPFEIVGPKDVRGINSDAVTAMFPKPNTSDNETTFCPYVTFGAVDFPWRYTPELPRNAANQPSHTGHKLKPWLALLVGIETTERRGDGEIELLPNRQVHIERDLLDQYPLDQSSAWAHVQSTGDRHISRLLSTRVLPANASLIAVLVPTFDDDAGLAWQRDQAEAAVLPMLHHWRFSTGAAGDFVTLAAKLKPGRARGDMGKADLHYDLNGVKRTFQVRGAMAPVGSRDAAVPQQVRNEFLAMTGLPRHDERNRPVTSMPIYGEAWIERHQHHLWRNLPNPAPEAAQVWQAQANQDPRHRVVAGLGAWCAVTFQEQIVDEIDHQAGDLYVAAARVRKLSSGLNAASALWRRRLPQTPEERLMLFGPALARLMGEDGSALAKLCAEDRPLEAALFSSAARRALRNGSSRTNHVQPGANQPGAVYNTANHCPAPRSAPGNAVTLPEIVKAATGKDYRDVLKAILEKEETPDDVPFKEITKAFEQWVERLLKAWLAARKHLESGAKAGGPLPIALLEDLTNLLKRMPLASKTQRKSLEKKLAKILEQLSHWEFASPSQRTARRKLIESMLEPPPKRRCKSIDTDQADRAITAAFDPTHPQSLMVKRVLDTITGLDPRQPTAPLEIGIDFDFTPWKFLRDLAPNWLLPGLDQVASNQVFAMQTNPAFIDAFLLGFNKQVLSEARWRNVPLQTGTTPCRIFWGRPNPQDPHQHLRDIQPVETWGSQTPIGDPSHQTPEAGGNDLVLFIRSDLFKRYPDTVISLRKAASNQDNPQIPDWEADPLTEPLENNQRLPVFMGVLSEDIYFFGFDIEPVAARDWWVCMEEPDSAPRFRNATGFPAGIESDAEAESEDEDNAQNYAAALAAGDAAQLAANAVRAPSVVLIRGSAIIPRPLP